MEIGFEMTAYHFTEGQHPATVNVIKRGMSIRDLEVYVSPLNYSEFENMGLPLPFGLAIGQQPSDSAQCKLV